MAIIMFMRRLLSTVEIIAQILYVLLEEEFSPRRADRSVRSMVFG